MTPPSEIPSDGQPVSPTRQRFLERLVELAIKPTTHEYYVQWAEAWTKARGNRSATATTAFFDALGRSSHLYDWQFRGERRRPAGCVWHPAAHSSARVQSVCASRPIRAVQDLMGHTSVGTTMIYLLGMKHPGAGAPSPED